MSEHKHEPSIGLIPPPPLRSGAQARESAFSTTAQGRPLRVIVDTETAPQSLATDLLVREFGHRPSVELLTTTDAPGLLRLRIGGRRRGGDGYDYVEVEYERDGGVVSTGIWGAEDWERHAHEEAAEHGTDAAEVLAALLLLKAAENLDADALVTERAAVLREGWSNMRREAALVTAEQALALVGLHLRSRGDYTWAQKTPDWSEYIPLNRYYLAATRQLLPASWRWAHGASDHFGATGNSAPVALADSALDRFARTLRIRDLLHIEYQRPPSGETAFEVRRHFDTLLWTLNAAFDASARVAHYTYGVPLSVRRASWRYGDWLDALDPKAPALVHEARSPATSDVIGVVAELRHTIHGEALSQMGFVTYGGPTLMSPAVANPVLVPQGVMQDIEPLLDRLGGAEAWGVRLREPAHIHAGIFCERLFPLAIAALNRLMEATDVAHLPDVDASELATGPPPWVEAHSEEQRARWQAMLGLAA